VREAAGNAASFRAPRAFVANAGQELVAEKKGP
jgi:hypothetical protein